MKYIFLLALLGCGDGFDLSVSSSGAASIPSDGPMMEDCLQLSTTMVDFESLQIDELPQSVEVSINDECDLLPEIEWALDDPDGVFDIEWTSDETIEFTLDTTRIGSWEAQYIGTLSQSNILRIQVFGNTVQPE